MKYFKLERNDGIYWITKNISKLLTDLGMIHLERRLRSCYDDNGFYVFYEGYHYRQEKIKTDNSNDIQYGMFQNGIQIKDEDYKESLPEKMEISESEIKAERIFTRKPQSLDEVIKMFEIDSKVWECSKFTVSNWDITSTKANRTATNYAVKAEFKKRNNIINYQELVDKFINDVNRQIPKFTPKAYNYKKEDNMLEVNLADIHIGKLSWNQETGEDYDWKIAKSRVELAINEIIEKNKNKEISKIVLVIGNDLLHFDSINKTTTAGTPQDTDIRWQKMFNVTCDLMIDCIQNLSDLAPVDCIYVPSNHDFQTTYYLMMYLSAFYKCCDYINIDTSPKPRKYYEWGNNLIGYSHGDKEKGRISGIMQIEASEFWGRTKYRFWHLGHLHSEHVREENGIIIRNISSVTGTDAWHNIAGYIGATKKAQSFLFNKVDGLLEIQNTVIR